MSSKVKLNSIDLKSISGVMVDIDDTLYSYKIPNDEGIKACYESLKSSPLSWIVEFIKTPSKKILLVSSTRSPLVASSM